MKQIIQKFNKSDNCQAAWDQLVREGVNPNNLSTYWLKGQFWLVCET